MDIFDYAMKMEKDGEAYYRELAGYTSNKGIKSILTMLADQEVKHYEILKKMSQKTDSDYVLTDVLDDAKNIFEKMKSEKQAIDFSIPQKDLYEKARDIEKQSYEFYLEKSKEVDDSKQQEILETLAEEEKRHMFLMKNFVEFVSRPDTWIEDAEFYKLEEY